MNLSEQASTLSSRLSALAHRMGWAGRIPRQIVQRASALQLPFENLSMLRDSIWWQAGAPLQQLVDLPRSALSGPVQEDKAEAHAMLIRVVEQHQEQFDSFDLRLINGVGGDCSQEPLYTSFEAYSAVARCRRVRIISYKDFVKAMSLALPRFLAGDTIKLCKSSWNGDRLFWEGEQQREAFACAIAYARRRELEVTLPAHVTSYRLSSHGLNAIKQRYHVLAMPTQAWNDPAFMGLLLDNGLPYSRLALLRSPGDPEFLLLPKSNPCALALGEGLRLAGAPDVLLHMTTLNYQLAVRQTR